MYQDYFKSDFVCNSHRLMTRSKKKLNSRISCSYAQSMCLCEKNNFLELNRSACIFATAICCPRSLPRLRRGGTLACASAGYPAYSRVRPNGRGPPARTTAGRRLFSFFRLRVGEPRPPLPPTHIFGRLLFLGPLTPFSPPISSSYSSFFS